MANTKNLYETVGDKAYRLRLPFPEIRGYVSNNLKYKFFDRQKNAFENFLTYQWIKEREEPNTPTHLMFNMATGTWKTLLMGSLILRYYKQWYRHFIFFVNQNNIVDKTENNFIDSSHTKFIFKEKIVIDDETIQTKKVDTFSDNPQGIEIKFTTIQKLYNDIHLQKENQTTLDDLHEKNIIMLADEAHHLNADTKGRKNTQNELIPTEITGRTSDSEIERKWWEHTVIELILHKNWKWGDNRNALIEFTATIPENEEVAKKYEDKIIYKFWLKEFLSAWYTKEINLISSTLWKKERIIQTLLFQRYRHKIALKWEIQNFKPVILFRSKFADQKKEENSFTDMSLFLDITQNITANDFKFLDSISQKISDSKSIYEQWKSRTEQMMLFIKNEGIHLWEIAEWIKVNFTEKNTIITNSKTNKTKSEKTTEDQEKLLNSLEDKNNHIRAIFTVDRLTEWWDVLNLFDIVRLYQWQNTWGSTRKTPEATTKEKQLIWRGVRYYPFFYNEKIANKRKFDDDLNHELRVLEELYYHTYDEESKYISHLKQELRKDWYIRDDKIIKTFSIKKSFQETPFYKNSKIRYNKPIDNPNRKKKTLSDIKKQFTFTKRIQWLEINEQEVSFDETKDIERLNLQEKWLQTIIIQFKDIEKNIFLKALNIKSKQTWSLYQFINLKKELEIESVDELQSSRFLGDFDIKIVISKNSTYSDISPKEKLLITTKFLEAIFSEIKNTITTKVWSEFIPWDFKKLFAEPKMKSILEDPESDKISKDLENEKRYILDSFYWTSEEKELIHFIRESVWNLEKKYNEFYLLRNEEVYKIYDFDKWRGFQPDFILFLDWKWKNPLQYQIFIEPKGSQYLWNDWTFKSWKESWKEIFLDQITEKYWFDNIISSETPNYRLVWLPFFNKDHNSNFKQEFEKIIS